MEVAPWHAVARHLLVRAQSGQVQAAAPDLDFPRTPRGSSRPAGSCQGGARGKQSLGNSVEANVTGMATRCGRFPDAFSRCAGISSAGSVPRLANDCRPPCRAGQTSAAQAIRHRRPCGDVACARESFGRAPGCGADPHLQAAAGAAESAALRHWPTAARASCSWPPP